MHSIQERNAPTREGSMRMRTPGTLIKKLAERLVVELVYDTHPRRAKYDRLFVAAADTAPRRGM